MQSNENISILFLYRVYIPTSKIIKARVKRINILPNNRKCLSGNKYPARVDFSRVRLCTSYGVYFIYIFFSGLQRIYYPRNEPVTRTVQNAADYTERDRTNGADNPQEVFIHTNATEAEYL